MPVVSFVPVLKPVVFSVTGAELPVVGLDLLRHDFLGVVIVAFAAAKRRRMPSLKDAPDAWVGTVELHQTTGL